MSRPYRRATSATPLLLLLFALAGCSDGSGGGPSDAGTGDTGPIDTGVPDAGLTPEERQARILDAQGCDPISPYDCGFPFPSDVYRLPAISGPSAHRIHIPNDTVIPPANSGASTDLAILEQSDGFSPGGQALVRLPGATAVGLPDAEHIGDSLLPDCPTVLLDADTGARVPHWAELDLRSQVSPTPAEDGEFSKRAILIRPAQRLASSHRYLVAIRDVVDASGTPIAPSPVFAALRDGTASSEDTVTLRREAYEDHFARLEAAGVARDTLQIVWDFTTASEENDTRRMLSMRDRAFTELGAGNSPPYTIVGMVDSPSNDPNVRRILRGRITVPMYLSQVAPGGTMTIGADGLPAQNGTAEFPFVVVIPNTLVAGPLPIVQFGHGIFGSAEDVLDRRITEMAADHGAVLVGQDWLGLSSADLEPLANVLLDGDMAAFATVPDRGQQAMLNAMLIVRMMQYGLADDPIAQPDATPTIDPTTVRFFGASLGGIYGASYLAITPDIARGMIGVPGQSFDLLLPRSELFDEFLIALGVNWDDRVRFPLLLGVAQMLWDRVEPTGYAHHLRQDPLPGVAVKEVFMLSALGDHLVSNYASLIMARSIGLPMLQPAVRTRYGVPMVTGPTTGGAWLELDYGLPTVPVGNLPATAGSDPHGTPFGEPVIQDAIYQFLETGTIANPCSGVCDPYEAGRFRGTTAGNGRRHVTLGNVDIRPLELPELRLATPLPPRFVASRPLGTEHRRSVLSRHPEGVLEVRRRGVVVARAYVVRGPREWLTARPSWERVSDGGLARHDDPEGEVAWIYGFEASPAFEPGDVAALLESVVSSLTRRRGRTVAIAVRREDAAHVQAVLGPVSTLPIEGHFPGPEGRIDATLLVHPGKHAPTPPSLREKVRIAAVQYPMLAHRDLDASFAGWTAALAEAVARGAEIVLFPELLTTEWLVHDEGSVDLYQAIRALDAHRSRYLAHFSELARLHGVAIVAGTHYTVIDGMLENVAYAFTPDGVVHRQPKLHPTPYEAETFGLVPGHGVRVIELAGVRCGILICYDAEFPETARAARAGGAELLLVPYNTELPAGHHRVRRGASARAVENQVYVVTAGAVGRFEHRFDAEEHHAASAVFGPSDRGFPEDGVLDEVQANVGTTMVVELELAKLRSSLRGGAVRPWLDRTR